MKKKFSSLYNQSVILDTNTIIDMDELNQLVLPTKLFEDTYYSKNAFLEELDEKTQGLVIQTGYSPLCIETNVGYNTLFDLRDKYKGLSTCDKVVISIAAERKIFCCTNDKPARQACVDIGIETTGTIGILCGCYESGIIRHDELTALFNQYVYDCSPRLGPAIIKEIRGLYKIPDISSEVIDI